MGVAFTGQGRCDAAGRSSALTQVCVAPPSRHANGAGQGPSAASIELAHRAFAACQGSYAPYSDCPSGVEEWQTRDNTGPWGFLSFRLFGLIFYLLLCIEIIFSGCMGQSLTDF